MADRAASFPDGIADHHARRPGVLHRHANPLSLLILATPLALALSGVLGGGKSTTHVDDAPAARLAVNTPDTLRNGMFFETRIAFTAKRPLRDATVALPPGLWKDITVNTHVPAAGEESYEQGTFRFHYGPLAAGETFEVKIDGQINPPLVFADAGAVLLYDGDERLAQVPLTTRVLP